MAVFTSMYMCRCNDANVFFLDPNGLMNHRSKEESTCQSHMYMPMPISKPNQMSSVNDSVHAQLYVCAFARLSVFVSVNLFLCLCLSVDL